MRTRTLQFGCLFLLSIVLFGHMPPPAKDINAPQSPSKTLPYRSILAVGKESQVKFNCPTGSFWISYVDFGWSMNPCGNSSHVVEVYINYSGPAFTDGINFEYEIRDESDFGSSSSYTWSPFYYGGTNRAYVGQNWEEWSDNNCNDNIDWGELTTHTYYKTGNSQCPF